MKKYFIVFFLILLCACGKQYQLERTGVEFDADDDGVFDDTFKFDVDNLYDGGAQIPANSRSVLKAANYAAIRALLDLEPGTDLYSIAALDILLAAKQDSATASTDTERLAHEYNTSVHNDSCDAGSGNCRLVLTGNTITFSEANASGQMSIWAEFIDGSWHLYRQGYGEGNPTEIKGGYIDETGNFVMSGQIDFAGEVTAPTQDASDNSNKVATMAAVQAAIAAALGSAGVDTYPADYSFTDVEDANVTTEYDDNMTVTGIDSTTSISISGGGGEYQINAGSRTSAAGTVALNDVVTVYLDSSSLNSTMTSTALNVGGLVRSFNVTTVAGGGSVCTGDIAFDWPMTADIVSANNISVSGGCTVGDATILLESAASGETSPAGRTGYSLYIPGSYDTASFDIANTDGHGDIFDTVEGTITFDLYVHTWANSAWLAGAIGLANSDQFQIELYSDNELRVSYEGANAGPVRATTSTADLAVDTWYTVTVKWRQGATDPSVSITVNGSTATADTDLTTWTTLPTELNIGNPQGPAPAYYIKNFRTYTAWQ